MAMDGVCDVDEILLRVGDRALSWPESKGTAVKLLTEPIERSKARFRCVGGMGSVREGLRCVSPDTWAEASGAFLPES